MTSLAELQMATVTMEIVRAHHDVENDAHAPDVGQLWDVWYFHEDFRRGVCVAATVRLAALQVPV